MIVKWPNKISVGITLPEPITSLDIGATSIAMAGGNPEQSGLHGKDIRPYLTQHSKDAPHDILYWHTAKGNNPEASSEKAPSSYSSKRIPSSIT